MVGDKPIVGGEPPANRAHQAVMLAEVVEALRTVPPGVVVDATLGADGHAAALLNAMPDHRLVGLDRDDTALAVAGDALARFGDRVVLRRANFDEPAGVLSDLGRGAVSAVLFDRGFSSMQLDEPDRGFSYRGDEPLDVRADCRQRRTAADVVNGYDEADLRRLLAVHGEERFAGRIARAIVAARPLATTGHLPEVIRGAIPAAARRHGGHPAKRSFQAIRIEVNGELATLGATVDQALGLLGPPSTTSPTAGDGTRTETFTPVVLHGSAARDALGQSWKLVAYDGTEGVRPSGYRAAAAADVLLARNILAATDDSAGIQSAHPRTSIDAGHDLLAPARIDSNSLPDPTALLVDDVYGSNNSVVGEQVLVYPDWEPPGASQDATPDVGITTFASTASRPGTRGQGHLSRLATDCDAVGAPEWGQVTAVERASDRGWWAYGFAYSDLNKRGRVLAEHPDIPTCLPTAKTTTPTELVSLAPAGTTPWTAPPTATRAPIAIGACGEVCAQDLDGRNSLLVAPVSIRLRTQTTPLERTITTGLLGHNLATGQLHSSRFGLGPSASAAGIGIWHEPTTVGGGCRKSYPVEFHYGGVGNSSVVATALVTPRSEMGFPAIARATCGLLGKGSAH